MPVLPNSRNLLTDVVEVINPISGNLTQPPFVDLRQRVSTYAPDDVFVTVSNTSTWPMMALQILGDARYWWAIADLSDVVDPFADLVVGQQVRSPSSQRLAFSILSPQNTQG